MKPLIMEREEHAVDSRVLVAGGNAVLYGRWQNEKYFKGVGDDVRAAFQFRHPLDGESKKLAEEIASCDSVALCVRRGDYVAFANTKKIWGETDASYYSRAIADMNKRVPGARYFVFSDDLDWCRKNLELPPLTIYIGKLGPKWSFHLELMSLCRHSIIPNSTFYWWGAWLNRNPEKIVIAPARWYPHQEKQPDIVPDRWTKL